MPADPNPLPLPPGRIDIHSHMLPGIDDGCETSEDSIASVQRLKAVGYVGTICTPHVWPLLFPANTIQNITDWTTVLNMEFANRGIGYRLWPGGELRLFKQVLKWLQANGVPTLAGSRYVLVDFWEKDWPKWATKAFEWLLREGYKPILAHPERLDIADISKLEKHLDMATQMGILLQGNFQPMTGELGPMPDDYVRRFIRDRRYTFMAMDMHRPHALQARLDGFAMVADEFGQPFLDQMTITNPRKLILGEPAD